MSVDKPIVGHRKLRLKHLIAAGEHSIKELAEMFESAEGTINQFKHRYRDDIRRMQENLADEFAGLWIADKRNRIQVYEDQVERFQTSDDPKLVARTQTALRSVAEELGALPQRVQVQQEKQTVHVVLEGTDNSKLQEGLS